MVRPVDKKRCAKQLIRESVSLLAEANRLLHKIETDNVEAINESLCCAIKELKGCEKAL